ncbi:riboflavin biosynthesis protein RibBA [Actinomycetospora sp. NBRC 106375]|uniref:3,4-dihydroxy-2-butanone-4-phosphate synthase n=1 Tax=Actinomycetospora sp. NBRC 106375 TaxID=3032207 RepID=UPI0024A2BA6D|nr:3,4-dihydroxy-2-butanone-4-phosphate synthase [Actinomycetospora sp. NBRC 106375]GLZ49729.1 riboflavin biosynthesis protein RibBA [Actinomycetospora sp. NBRC 106375]
MPELIRARPAAAWSGEPLDRALAALARGQMIVLMDDEDRENEADLVMSASAATEATVAFMVTHTTGILCCPMPGDRLDALDLPLMVERNSDTHGTAFTVSVDHRSTSSGVSADDRARTVRALGDAATSADDLRRPGHVFPLRSRDGGVLQRAGHTEATVDLLRMAGVPDVGLISELVEPSGAMLRGPGAVALARRHGLELVTVADVARRRRARVPADDVELSGEALLPTDFGRFRAYSFRSRDTGIEHLALVLGDPAGEAERVPVRLHSECLTGDVLGSLRCDCGTQLRDALRLIAARGVGVVVYLRGQEGRGIGLGHKLRAYSLQESGLDTVEANAALGLPVDSRDYAAGAAILLRLGTHRVELITNNPAKSDGLVDHGIEVVSHIGLRPRVTEENGHYLRTKRDRLGHRFADTTLESPPVAPAS